MTDMSCSLAPELEQSYFTAWHNCTTCICMKKCRSSFDLWKRENSLYYTIKTNCRLDNTPFACEHVSWWYLQTHVLCAQFQQLENLGRMHAFICTNTASSWICRLRNSKHAYKNGHLLFCMLSWCPWRWHVVPPQAPCSSHLNQDCHTEPRLVLEQQVRTRPALEFSLQWFSQQSVRQFTTHTSQVQLVKRGYN